MGRAKCFLTYSRLALAMRGVFVNSVTRQTRNAVAKRCVFADFMDAQRRISLSFVTQGVDCASCMCNWGIRHNCL